VHFLLVGDCPATHATMSMELHDGFVNPVTAF
jgi:hypothetical protein